MKPLIAPRWLSNIYPYYSNDDHKLKTTFFSHMKDTDLIPCEGSGI